jgi:hypothetical protein
MKWFYTANRKHEITFNFFYALHLARCSLFNDAPISEKQQDCFKEREREEKNYKVLKEDVYHIMPEHRFCHERAKG